MTESLTAKPEPASPAWTEADLHDPHHTADKARRVEQMFSAIAKSYDLNNRLHSMWRDQAWRKAAVKMAELKGNEDVVDVACGTGDLSMAFRDALDRINQGACEVIGIDFTHDMLQIARHKQREDEIEYLQGDAMKLPLPEACCDVVSIAFGIRNVAVPEAAMAEFYRVLRPGGRLIILEFSTPTNPVVRFFDRIYREHIMPRTATWIARDKSGAYKYLPRSVNTFLDRAGMQTMMRGAGFVDLAHKSLTFGVAICYRGVKRGG